MCKTVAKLLAGSFFLDARDTPAADFLGIERPAPFFLHSIRRARNDTREKSRIRISKSSPSCTSFSYADGPDDARTLFQPLGRNKMTGIPKKTCTINQITFSRLFIPARRSKSAKNARRVLSRSFRMTRETFLKSVSLRVPRGAHPSLLVFSLPFPSLPFSAQPSVSACLPLANLPTLGSSGSPSERALYLEQLNCHLDIKGTRHPARG